MDVFGQALLDYYHQQQSSPLWLFNNYGSPEEMPVDVFFREEAELPELELMALRAASGKILDIGAGVGSHALVLQNQGADVTALEISGAACEIMKDRGVMRVINADIFNHEGEHYDTLLLLMNGIGLTGTLAGLRDFLNYAKNLLNPGGSIIFDSSDISYLYEDIPLPAHKYFGEIAYRYEYKAQLGDWFNWLYIDANLLLEIASAEGWATKILSDDGMDQYLARLRPN
jgi:precorrin-6B methylase 2